MSNMDLIAEARHNAPFSEDESLLMRLANALEEALALNILTAATALTTAAEEMREERSNWCLDDNGRYWINRTLDELRDRATEATR